MHKYCLLIMFFIVILLNIKAYAQAEQMSIPRFAVIRSAKMNSRIGPGFDYPVIWHYWRKDMPVEIIEDYDQWRKIKDIDGDTSWVYQSLLTGGRTAIVKEVDNDNMRFLPILTSPRNDAHMISQIEGGAIVKIKNCDSEWCYINAGKITGYVQENKLWGLYNKEIIK